MELILCQKKSGFLIPSSLNHIVNTYNFKILTITPSGYKHKGIRSMNLWQRLNFFLCKNSKKRKSSMKKPDKRDYHKIVLEIKQ